MDGADLLRGLVLQLEGAAATARALLALAQQPEQVPERPQEPPVQGMGQDDG